MKTKIISIFTNITDKNLAFHVPSLKNDVFKNRIDMCKKYNFNYENLKSMNQVHGNVVKITTNNTNIYDCDALITNQKNTPLMVMVADCIPILFYDKTNNVIAVAHAGRNGTYLNIVSSVINKMINDFSCNPSNIQVELGASIQSCCYEVSTDLVNIAIKNFGNDIAKNKNIDLQKINKNQLLDLNILNKNIKISKICTKCNGNDYFSYRNDKSCGRFAGLISLQ